VLVLPGGRAAHAPARTRRAGRSVSAKTHAVVVFSKESIDSSCMKIVVLAKTSFCLAALAAVLLCARPSLGVDLEHIQPASIAQPLMHAALQPAAGGPPYESDLLGFNITGYLDTGSSGIVISDLTASFLELPTEPGVTFEDVSVGGSSQYAVSQPLQFRLNSTNDPDIGNIDTFETVYDAVYGPWRVQVGPTDGVFDVYGMPVMMGKTAVIDPKQGDPILLLSAPAYVYEPGTPFHSDTADTNPGIPDTNHHVKLSYGDFSRFTQTTDAMGQPADPPVFDHNPFVGPNPLLQLEESPPPDNTPPVRMSFDGIQTSGSFLLDTGGSASFLSEHTAAEMHVRIRESTRFTETPQLEEFDPLDPQGATTLVNDQFVLQFQGLGGVITVPGFYLDDLMLQTMEGSADPADPNNIRYVKAPMIVYDISAMDPVTGDELFLDGVFGMNFLLDSLLIDETGMDILDYQVSPFQWITFDETSGILGLDLMATPEPSSYVMALCGLVVLAGYAWRRRRRRGIAAHGVNS
jgi:MYXO-CTERM domain-containing protein